MGSPQPSYTKASDGTSIAYLVMGDGPVDPVYAFGYQSNIDADGDVPFHAAFRERLAKHFRLILFDRRGTGLSDRTGVEGPGALELGMDDLLAVMDAAKSDRALLFGVSNGAMLSALFAASHPQRTLGLVVWALYGRGTRASDYPYGTSREEWAKEVREAVETWGSIEYAEREMQAVAPSTSMDRDTIERVAKMFRAVASPATAAAAMLTIGDADIRPVLTAIQVPTLALHPVDEWLDEGRYTASLVPGASFIEIPTKDAHPFWEASERVVDEIQRFAAKIRHEEEVLDRVLATVLFTDIVGSTAHAHELGDRAWRELVERHHGVVRAILARYRGREVDTAGDGFFALFDGPARGVRCAQALTEAVRPLGLEIRAGLHAGEVELSDSSVRGIAVHIGARVGHLAGPSQVLVSSTVKDLVAGSGLEFEDAGDHELKGVPDRWHLYRAVGQTT